MQTYKTNKRLVIVESPAKCKKIEGYLGAGYTCVATYGHLRTIPSLQHIHIENQFEPSYELIDDPLKKRQVEILRKHIQKADEVIIASDNDREGEMIGQTILDLFHLPAETKRIVFNEITESALQYAIQHPQTINRDLVNAQKTRQILDVLVGFKVSPVLWKLVAPPKGKGSASLSAGRCQTPALKLVYENQQEIDRATPSIVYHTTGYFTKLNIPFDLNKSFAQEDDMVAFLDDSIAHPHVYMCSTPIQTHKSPPAPFTTSRLQQVASNVYRYSPKETMRVCQQLYEAGYITYMRTDSDQYSAEFLDAAKAFIRTTYSERHVGPDIKRGKKTALCQEAHEAIRPTDLSLQTLSEEVDAKQRKMYKLIWTNTVESCMTDATYWSITATVSAPADRQYTYTAEQCDFPGWKSVQQDFSRENKEYQYLQTIKSLSTIPYKKVCARSTMTGAKSHYTEARLVHLLEEKGIGRPSTFSAILDKLLERGYVKKENVLGKEFACKDFELESGEISQTDQIRVFGKESDKLVIQPLGIIVSEFLETHFQSLFDYDYTRHMEADLDRIAQGDLIWNNVCAKCNSEIDTLVEQTRSATKFEVSIDEQHTYMIGKYGPVVKYVEDNAVTFKPVKKGVDVHQLLSGGCSVTDIVDDQPKAPTQIILGKHEGHDLILRKGKFGLYVSWGKESKTLKELGNRPIDNIAVEEVMSILAKGSTVVRDITPHLSIRKGPKGDYLFYKTPKMKKPTFHSIQPFVGECKEDYKTCHLTVLKSWIASTYQLSI
ncbi:MAG: type IA DNA topoisomerase [Flavobacterium sp.]